ncbi:MAG: GGDEF domain-containing protein [Spirochaetales bacterium]|nr:GGDEF domain-containing protein [Spirochaetales bacterium]
MSKKSVFIIKNNLSFINGILEMIAKKASFRLVSVDLDELLQDHNHEKTIKEGGQTNIFVVIESGWYEKNNKKLSRFFANVCNTTFSNYIYVHKDDKFLTDKEFILGKKNCWYFSEDMDEAGQAISFISYIANLFEKVIISARLTDYIIDSFKEAVYSEILVRKNKEIEHLNKELEKKNKIDYLTNLYNRKALYDFLDLERKRTLRDLWRLDAYVELSQAAYQGKVNIQFSENRPRGSLSEHFGVFSIMMIDIDNFKAVNDKYGHLVGDSVLKTLGELLLNESILRENDIAGRFGGEEFVIILPETNSEHALEPATRLAERFRNIAFITGEDQEEEFYVTLSIGISQYHEDDKTNDEIIHRADKALYYAKRHGKGKVIIYERVFDNGDEIPES